MDMVLCFMMTVSCNCGRQKSAIYKAIKPYYLNHTCLLSLATYPSLACYFHSQIHLHIRPHNGSNAHVDTHT